MHENLADFALQKAEEHCHGNVSSYFAELLRKERQAEIDADVKFLDEQAKHSNPGPEPVKEIVSACKRARRQMLKEARQKEKRRKK